MGFLTRVSVTGICALVAAAVASATVINTVQLSAASGGGQVTVTNNNITFSPGSFGNCPQNNAAPYSDSTSFCDASVSGGNMMYGAANNIAVTTSFNAIIGDLVFAPPAVQQPFIMIDCTTVATGCAASGTDVIELALGGVTTPVTDNGTNCAGTTAGKTCVAFAASPFKLLANNGGSGTGGLSTTVTLSIFGTATDKTTGQVDAFTGTLSQTLNNMAPVDVQNLFAPGGVPSQTAFITTGFTGSLTASIVPEPNAGLLGFAGLLLLGGAYRRKK
jgi:hypothetical protein